MVTLDDVDYVVDENLLSLGNAMVAVRRDTARFSRAPVDELLPRGILDTEWIPIVGDRGWVMITNDRRLRTRPAEAELAIAHRLKVVHLHGKVANQPAWDQLVRVATRWSNVEDQQKKPGPWWLSLRPGPPRLMEFAPGEPERA
jgi:PIN like domain